MHTTGGGGRGRGAGRWGIWGILGTVACEAIQMYLEHRKKETSDSGCTAASGTMKEFLVEQDRCNSCGVCLEVCREGAMVMEGGRAFILGEKCTACGACHKSCPEGAVVLLIKRVVKKQCREELKKLS